MALATDAGAVYIVAAELAAQVIAACNLGETKELARFKGRVLERSTFQHPFLNRSILGVLAQYVTADAGTGAVHTAPSHGADDFYTGQRYDLDLTCRVDAGGFIHADAATWPADTPAPYDNKKVWAANPLIIELLKEKGALLAQANITHSYPHCWRCHKPVIFRATEQWFISLETPVKRADGTETSYRKLTIEEIDRWCGTRHGQGTHHEHDCYASRLVHQPPAHLGRADCRTDVHGLPEADHRCIAKQGDCRVVRERGRGGVAYDGCR